MKISIVMTFWNRKQQLLNTLKSIAKYNHDIEIIIVDDASTNGEDISYLANDYIKVAVLKDKTWINPCIGFNTGFSMATGDLIIIQNSECYHVGDILRHAKKNVAPNRYVTYSALSVNEEVTRQITEGADVKTLVAPFMERSIDVPDWDGNGWYNHSAFRPGAYHFCSAILRDDLYDLGGFDERYFDGLGFDDNELLARIHKKGMHISIIDYPFVVHQWHPKFQPGDVPSLMYPNGVRLDETKANDYYDVKPYNNIYK